MDSKDDRSVVVRLRNAGRLRRSVPGGGGGGGGDRDVEKVRRRLMCKEDETFYCVMENN